MVEAPAFRSNVVRYLLGRFNGATGVATATGVRVGAGRMFLARLKGASLYFRIGLWPNSHQL
jgi:hypothetical protein